MKAPLEMFIPMPLSQTGVPNLLIDPLKRTEINQLLSQK
jgi:hypothetical protein